MSVITFLLALLLFVGLLTTIPFQLRFAYRRVGQDDIVNITFYSLHGLWKFCLEIPVLDFRWEAFPQLRLHTKVKPFQAKGKTIEEIKPRRRRFSKGLLRRTIGLMPRLLEAKRRFYKGISCTELQWKIEVGLENAAETGMVVGGVWNLIGYYLGKLHNTINFKVKHPVIEVYPCFQTRKVNVEINCIFKLRTAHLIFAGFKALKIIKVGLKGVKFRESPD
ncbi:MAG TPA: DUF2953 domain-containing protein [Desulfobacteria bacterium]|nr:DUF2953 domain-containing protein [Desulfobacteria bacterium]